MDAIADSIDRQDKENASIQVNVDSIVDAVCIKDFVWRYHDELDAWIYARHNIQRVLYSMVEGFLYAVDSGFGNTFCFSRRPLKSAWTFGWACIFSSPPKRIASATRRRSLIKSSSTDLLVKMQQLRLKRRRSSMPAFESLKT